MGVNMPAKTVIFTAGILKNKYLFIYQFNFLFY